MIKYLVAAAVFALIALPVATPVAAADPDCGSGTLVKSATIKVEVCVDMNIWEKSEGMGDQEFVYFSKDDKAGFAILTELPAIDVQAYHDAILQAATKQSAASSPVTSFDDATQEINGTAWASMRYDVAVQGIKYEFLNYYFSEQGVGSAQFIFWSAPEDADVVKSSLASPVMSTATVIE